MDEEGLEFFRNALNGVSCYLEFGSGGSTIYACNDAKINTVISVDSDLIWIENVKKEVRLKETNLYIDYVNIGSVGDWGTPVNNDAFRDFWKYSTSPWQIAARGCFAPEVVLIDGRFRVACFLYTMLAARKDTLVLFDDYLDRPEYFIAERYCELKLKVGRMGIFLVSKQFSIENLVADYARYTLCSD